jgi:hypothetical protein
MKPINIVQAALIAAILGAGAGSADFTWAKRASADKGASMVKPPRQPASGANAQNPDNMPTHAPTRPTHDPMAHPPPPASAAIAK